MKKHVLSKVTLITLLLLIVSVAFIIQACSPKSNKVTFMLNDKEVATVNSKDGLVTLPNSPEKYGYEFAGWFTDKDLTKRFNPKKDKIKEDTIIYGKFIEKMVKVFIDGEDNGEKKLLEIKDYKPTKPGLTLDAWYVDEDCKTKYESQDISKIYAQFKAKVVFNNGYEDIYETFAPIKKPLNKPTDEEIVGDIVYMDKDNLFFKDIDGNDFDFNKNIEGNTRINVLFVSKYIRYRKKDGNANNGNYIACVDDSYITEIRNFKVLSILSNVRVGYIKTSNNQLEKVENIIVDTVGTPAYSRGAEFLYQVCNIENLYFGDGIKLITNIDPNQALSPNTTIKTIRFPESLEIIDTSFNNIIGDNLEYKLPSNVKAIYNSFYEVERDLLNPSPFNQKYKNLPQVISLPDSIINLSNVLPSSFKFSDDSIFKIEEISANQKMLIKKAKAPELATLISIDPDKDGNIKVPNTIGSIQVMAFFMLNQIKNIYLPKTIESVSYNLDIIDYPFYNGASNERMKAFNSIDNFDPNSSNYASASIVDEHFDNQKIIFDTKSYPSTLSAKNILLRQKISSSQSKIVPYNTIELGLDMVLFKGQVDSGQDCQINLTFYDEVNGNEKRKLSFNVTSGTTLTHDFILEEIRKFDGGKYKNYIYLSETPNGRVTEFGIDFNDGDTIIYNMYFETYITLSFSGIKYEDGLNPNEIIIVSFDNTNVKSTTDGGYIIKIPNSIDDKNVVEIKDEAFMPDAEILKNPKTEPTDPNDPNYADELLEYNKYKFELDKLNIKNVTLGSKIKTIGMSAFKDLPNLTNVIFGQNSELSIIKKSAFEQLSLQSKLKSITVPLNNLTSVEPFAFRARNLEEINTNDVDHISANSPFEGKFFENCEVGKYYILPNSGSKKSSLIIYNGKTEGVKKDDKDYVVHDIKLVAIAAAAEMQKFIIGASNIKFAQYGLTITPTLIRYELMEGSIYFAHNKFKYDSNNNKYVLDMNDNYVNGIFFVAVSKVHKNAFTEMSDKIFEVKRKEATDPIALIKLYTLKDSGGQYTVDQWITTDTFKDTSVFEDGWWQGITSDDPDYANKMWFLDYLKNYDDSLPF